MVKQNQKRGLKTQTTTMKINKKIAKQLTEGKEKVPHMLKALENTKNVCNGSKTPIKRQKPQFFWADTLQKDQCVSAADYMKIIGIMENYIEVQLSNGDINQVTSSYIGSMHSSVYYRQEQECIRSELVEKLQSAGDKVFTVVFHKKLQPENIAMKLEQYKAKDFAQDKKLRKIAKDIISGDLCNITGRLKNSVAKLGRSTIIDMDVEGTNNIRQVDHRTIECLILAGTKYVLKGLKDTHKNVGECLKVNEDYPIRQGDLYSKVLYLQYIKPENKKKLLFKSLDGDYTIDKDIVNECMKSANYFETVKHVTRTELVEAFDNVKESVFTVRFHKQITEKCVVDILAGLTKKQLDDPKYFKNLAPALVEGEECEVTGYLYKSENDMGRSLIIDLNAGKQPAYRQVDHRSIKSIICENTKYEVK